MYSSIADDANKLNKLEPTYSRKKMLTIFVQSQEVFIGPETDVETDHESANGETDNEQPGTTDMPGLETEESAEQTRKQKGRGLNILTPQLTRLSISLAQLEAGHNSEKLKNEIRQLRYLLYRSIKLSKTIYNSLMNAILKMETLFMNTENSKTNKPHKFRLTLADKLILKILIKIWH